MLKFFPILGVLVLVVILSASSDARPQLQRRQLLDKNVQNREQESDDLDDGAEKDDLKGSASYGYGYYGGYPFGGYGGGLYGGGLYGGGIYPYSYSLHSGYYGGYSPYSYYGGYGFPGHYF
ncbi:keratin, type I cytoskeletal 10 [Eupeodes corollae]|uniref:keratin, type I cytoskeletal 10 n=1 Tax=Eupeodes corollae TaxID=290404 RepID=UPI0024925338|nr:keratin, type I cytoskeletal 10 [Eupeodes corollae]